MKTLHPGPHKLSCIGSMDIHGLYNNNNNIVYRDCTRVNQDEMTIFKLNPACVATVCQNPELCKIIQTYIHQNYTIITIYSVIIHTLYIMEIASMTIQNQSMSLHMLNQYHTFCGLTKHLRNPCDCWLVFS